VIIKIAELLLPGGLPALQRTKDLIR